MVDNNVCNLLNDVDIVERIKVTHASCYRPPIPQQESEGVHPGMLTLMKQCWAEEPFDRPSFNDVAKTLKVINKGRSLLLFTILNSCAVFGHAFFQLNRPVRAKTCPREEFLPRKVLL